MDSEIKKFGAMGVYVQEGLQVVTFHIQKGLGSNLDVIDPQVLTATCKSFPANCMLQPTGGNPDLQTHNIAIHFILIFFYQKTLQYRLVEKSHKVKDWCIMAEFKTFKNVCYLLSGVKLSIRWFSFIAVIHKK